MKRFYGCDAHKKYSVFAFMDEEGNQGPSLRVNNDRDQFSYFLDTLPPGSPIALETVGNWYWMVDEMEQAGHEPRLTHAGKAKLMMGQINKTDKLDAKGLALLLRNGTLPSVWIPPAELRDQRELPRMRIAFVRVRTMLKNRIHAALAKYAIEIKEVSDIFGVGGRALIKSRLGEVERFPRDESLANYAGTVPRKKQSGGRVRFGKVRPDVNRYLKWALIEAANIVVLNQTRWPDRHVVRLYRRIRQRRGHAKAVVAVARHLAEATYWILTKNEPYREPKRNNPVSSTQK